MCTNTRSVIDNLTYAGNLANLKDIEPKPNYKFVKMDVCDFEVALTHLQDERADDALTKRKNDFKN